MFVIRLKKRNIILCCTGILIGCVVGLFAYNTNIVTVGAEKNDTQNKKFIKYAEFNPTYEALEKAMNEDIKSQDSEVKLDWIEILAILATKYGGNFKKYKSNDMDDVIRDLKEGKTGDKIIKENKNYNYYKEVYATVLKEFIGKYKTKISDGNSGEEHWEEAYGLKAFLPIAKTFPYNHYDDFGASRSYGYSRPHLGHDMMAATGTPVIAVESGSIEIMGWNQYGGWRIGIRSFDKKRYYYYAHLRQNRPFARGLKEGDVVKAGDVIGYVGRTGYSKKENVNNIEQSHLHWGIQLIFDESQKECDNEIWIDLYAITKLLEKNRSAVIRDNDTKEFTREKDFIEENLNFTKIT